MNFEHTDKVKDVLKRVNDFMEEHIYPIESEVDTYNAQEKNYWTHHPKIAGLKKLAKEQGLWNMFLPKLAIHYFSMRKQNIVIICQ